MGQGAEVAVMLHAAAFAATGTFKAGNGAATAGFVQAAADAAVPHVLRLRFHICLDFQTTVPVKYSNPYLIIKQGH